MTSIKIFLLSFFIINILNAQEKPNIILILADDFGWGDASCNNKDAKIKTPGIDRIANEGIRLVNAHTPSAVCTPTRYGVLTGRYPWRSYLKKMVLPTYAPAMIRSGRSTLASYLKAQGYHTAGFGKWHLGLDWTPKNGNEMEWRSLYETRSGSDMSKLKELIAISKPFKHGPLDIGFDYFWGTPSNYSRLPFFIENDRVAGTLEKNASGHLVDPTCEKGHADEFHMEKFIQFLKDHQMQKNKQPVFTYLALNAIHGSGGMPKHYEGKSGMGFREDRILWLNESLEKLHDTLDDLKMTDNTLLIFTSDNGPVWSEEGETKGHIPNGPYKGYKTGLWEGGTRVPFVARWPKHIPEGVVSDNLFGLTDIFATIAAICGTPLSKEAGTDSFNQLPLLLQKKNIKPRPALVTASYTGLFAIYDGQWKAILGTKHSGGFYKDTYYGESFQEGLSDDPSAGQLYNIISDPVEKEDLWERSPEVVSVLKKKFEEIRFQEPDDEFPWAP